MSELTPVRAPEAVRGPVVAEDTLPGTVVLADPTQVRRPWRSTARTIFQAALALASLLPFIALGWYDGDGDYPAVVVQVLAVAAAITRVMALPGVENFLRTFLPFLSAAPKETSA